MTPADFATWNEANRRAARTPRLSSKRADRIGRMRDYQTPRNVPVIDMAAARATRRLHALVDGVCAECEAREARWVP